MAGRYYLIKKMAMPIVLAFVLFFCIGSIQASDVNITDCDEIGSMEDVSLQIEDDNLSQSSDSNALYASQEEDFLKDTVKNQTEITVKTTNVYYKGSLSVTLKDLNSSNAIANRQVNFIINNVNYTANTGDDGVASVALSLNPGKYTLIAYFAGDDSYLASDNLTSTIQVLSTVKASDITKYYKGSAQYTATFYDSYGNPLTNRNVYISVGGKTYTKTTNSKGVASLAIDFRPGTYKVTSTNPVTGNKLTTNFRILSTIESSNLKKVKGDGNKFVAKFFKSNGKPLANKYIKYKLNGKSYKVKTSSKGQLVWAMNKFKAGTYKIVLYNKDGLSKSNTVKIFKIANTRLSTSFYNFHLNDTKEIKVKLSTDLGGYSSSGKIIKITVNGMTYSTKTDANGVVRLKLPYLDKGLYTVKYTFTGNRFFKSSKATNLVTVLNNTDPELTVVSTTSFGRGAGTQFKVALTADGVPLAKRTMTFSIGGKSYNVITNDYGIASVPINLDVGSYTINYRTYSQFGVNETSGSCSVTVFERHISKFTWKSSTSYKDSSQYFQVLLTDWYGNPLCGMSVKLTIDGKTYSGKTDSKGYFKVKTYRPLGKYNVLVKFKGTNYYLSSKVSKKITVKLSKFARGLNQKNKLSSLKKYSQSSKNCPVNSAKIKSLVKRLTKGLSNKVDKAKALFNYVKNKIRYAYYYDTKYGAKNTLKKKRGNCVDQAHLLIAMYRTAGFKARYVHGICSFSDGRFGHVWTQVLIGKNWVVGDPIDGINALGKINNWNTKNYYLHNAYYSLPF